MLSRRKFLGLGAATLGSLAVNPLDAFSWGAFKTFAPTHQLITDTAYNMLKNDILYFKNIVPFPEHREVLKHDWVFVNPTNMEHFIDGTGPDVEGKSPYSWHYRNPIKGWGKGPYAVSKHFEELMRGLHSNPKSNKTAKAASWMSHFIADMHVPYHVCGIPAKYAHRKNNARQYTLRPTESGPDLLYRANKIPIGWGGNEDFETAIQYFCQKFPLKVKGKKNKVDWFDPWYYNGISYAEIGTGSHAQWELDAHQVHWYPKRVGAMLRKIPEKDYYDPLWKNTQVKFGEKFWEPSCAQAYTFADLCAHRTLEQIQFFFLDPLLGMVHAMRAVLTLFRASMSSLTFKIIQKKQDNGHKKIITIVKNHNTYDTAQNVQVRLAIKENGKWQGNIHKIGRIAPNSQKQVTWNVKPQTHKNIKAHFDVSGFYNVTPDLGYNFKFFNIDMDQNHTIEDQVPPPQAQPQPHPAPSSNCSYNIPPGAQFRSDTSSYGRTEGHWMKLQGGFDWPVGSHTAWWDTQKKRLKSTVCRDGNGMMQGISTFYKSDGKTISSQLLYKDNKIIKRLK